MKTNKEILEEINAAVRIGNYEILLSYCSEDTKWMFIGDQDLNGKKAVQEYLKNAYLTPPKFTELLLADGNFVIATGEISLMDSNGQWLTSSYCDIWTFQDGSIAELKAFVIPAK